MDDQSEVRGLLQPTWQSYQPVPVPQVSWQLESVRLAELPGYRIGTVAVIEHNVSWRPNEELAELPARSGSDPCHQGKRAVQTLPWNKLEVPRVQRELPLIIDSKGLRHKYECVEHFERNQKSKANCSSRSYRPTRASPKRAKLATSKHVRYIARTKQHDGTKLQNHWRSL